VSRICWLNRNPALDLAAKERSAQGRKPKMSWPQKNAKDHKENQQAKFLFLCSLAFLCGHPESLARRKRLRRTVLAGGFYK